MKKSVRNTSNILSRKNEDLIRICLRPSVIKILVVIGGNTCGCERGIYASTMWSIHLSHRTRVSSPTARTYTCYLWITAGKTVMEMEAVSQADARAKMAISVKLVSLRIVRTLSFLLTLTRSTYNTDITVRFMVNASTLFVSVRKGTMDPTVVIKGAKMTAQIRRKSK